MTLYRAYKYICEMLSINKVKGITSVIYSSKELDSMCIDKNTNKYIITTKALKKIIEDYEVLFEKGFIKSDPEIEDNFEKNIVDKTYWKLIDTLGEDLVYPYFINSDDMRIRHKGRIFDLNIQFIISVLFINNDRGDWKYDENDLYEDMVKLLVKGRELR